MAKSKVKHSRSDVASLLFTKCSSVSFASSFLNWVRLWWSLHKVAVLSNWASKGRWVGRTITMNFPTKYSGFGKSIPFFSSYKRGRPWLHFLCYSHTGNGARRLNKATGCLANRGIPLAPLPGCNQGRHNFLKTVNKQTFRHCQVTGAG